jgi:hypothetical protein
VQLDGDHDFRDRICLLPQAGTPEPFLIFLSRTTQPNGAQSARSAFARHLPAEGVHLVKLPHVRSDCCACQLLANRRESRIEPPVFRVRLTSRVSN